MKKLLIILVIFLLSFLPFRALSLEVIIFNEKIELPEACMMVIPSKNNAFIKGSKLDCTYQDQSFIELTIGWECNFHLYTKAINEPGEKLAVEREENGVSYMEFHLEDRNKGTPIFSRVIRDESSCLIITGTSLSSIKEKTKSLWLIDS